MGEVVAYARPIIVDMECDECKNGLMRLTTDNIMLASYPPQYPHKCTNCGHVTNYNCTYPYHKLIPTESLREPLEQEKAYI